MPRAKVPCTGCGVPREVRSKDAKPLCQSCRRKRRVSPSPAPEAERHLAAVAQLPASDDDTLLKVLDNAAGGMAWLKPTDKAMLEVARRLARIVDDAELHADELAQTADAFLEVIDEVPASRLKALYARLDALAAAFDVSKAVLRVAPHLTATLRDLGGAPAERKGLDADGAVESKLDKIRATANRRTSRSG